MPKIKDPTEVPVWKFALDMKQLLEHYNAGLNNPLGRALGETKITCTISRDGVPVIEMDLKGFTIFDENGNGIIEFQNVMEQMQDALLSLSIVDKIRADDGIRFNSDRTAWLASEIPLTDQEERFLRRKRT